MKKKKGKRIFVLFALILLALGGYYYYITYYTKEEVKPEKTLKIVDVTSKTRPIAVMINNNHEAWPHSGLQDAYITYEILAEGGITRLMAIFKDKDTARIGSVRSSRPYYLDYALENDAIYVHFGWSQKAKSDIKSLGVDNINGLTESSVFWRDKTLNKATEHTVFTSMKKIKKYSKQNGYDRDTNKDLLLKYSVDEIDLSAREDAIKADAVYMYYSYYTSTKYKYDSEKKLYLRSMSGKKHVDSETGNQYTAKNIIITPIKNYSYDNYGRQALDNITKGNGYYITNGYAVPITFEKTSRSSQTKYRFKDGEEITVNDGNTFIQITPINKQVKISSAN